MINPDILPYRNIHEGETAIFFLTGPSLLSFDKNQIPDYDNITKFSVNKIYNYDSHLGPIDYYCYGDVRDEQQYVNQVNDYKVSKDKFALCGETWSVCHNFKKGTYESKVDIIMANWEYQTKEYMKVDIATNYLYQGVSTCFPAMVLILYMGFKTIYLIGADCKWEKGSWGWQMNEEVDPVICGGKMPRIDCLLQGWRDLKDVACKNRKDTKIISVNPVGLKGIMHEDIEARLETPVKPRGLWISGH